MNVANIVEKVEAVIQDAALIERAIASMVTGLKERAQPQEQIGGDVAIVQKALGELVTDIQIVHAAAQHVAAEAAPAPAPAKKSAAKRKR